MRRESAAGAGHGNRYMRRRCREAARAPSREAEACSDIRMANPGDLDTSFSGDGKRAINFGGIDAANALLVQPDRRIVVAGGGGPASSFCVARLGPRGGL